MKLNLSVFCFICCVAFSCSTKTETTDQTASKDSAAAPASIGMTPSAPVYDPADSGTFKGFIDLFSSSDAELPEWAIRFISDETVGRFTPKELIEVDSSYVLLFVQFVPVGPGVDKLWAVSFTKSGEFISEAELGESYPSSGPGGGGKDYSYTYDPTRKMINVSNSFTDWSEEKQEEFTNETWNPYYVDETGQVNQGRRFPEVSIRYLDESDLTNYSEDELKIMRNEIFAVYGYIFKTEPLKSHYGAMQWYKGERDNVDGYLNEIEKSNVALIKKVEESK